MIKSDMAFGKAQLVDMDSWAYKSGSYFEWKVYIGDRTIEEFGKYYVCHDDVLYKWVPVAYYRKDPNYFELLDSPAEFNAFNIPFPDSLSWMLDCRSQ